MPAIRIENFAGMWPAKEPRTLPDAAATSATNLDLLENGALRGVSAPTLVKALTAGTKKVFRLPLGDTFDLSSGANTWVEFAEADTDVLLTPITNDSHKRMYYCNATNGYVVATEAAPTTTYNVGVPAPTVPPNVVGFSGFSTVNPDIIGASSARLVDSYEWNYYASALSTWTSGNTAYEIGDVVEAAGGLYQLATIPTLCLSTARPGGTSGVPVTGADGYSWLYLNDRNWKSGVNYAVDDYVFVGKVLYRCKTDGGASSTNQPDIEAGTSGTYADGFVWQVIDYNKWVAGEEYEADAVVKSNREYYLCTTKPATPRTSTAPVHSVGSESSGDGFEWLRVSFKLWTTNTWYSNGDVVLGSGGTLFYVCTSSPYSNGQTTRSYVYTVVNSFGEESAPSPPTIVTGYFGYNSTSTSAYWSIFDLALPVMTGYAPAAAIHVYRTVTAASGVTTYFKVAELDDSATSTPDGYSDAEAASFGALETETWAVPVTGMKGIAQMPNGIFVGFKDNNIYFSEPYRPHAWPAEYTITVEHDVVGLGVFGNTCVTCTTGYPAAVSGSRPEAMSFMQTSTPYPCKSRRSIVPTPSGVIYSSTNALVMFGPGGVSEVTPGLIDRDDWTDYTGSGHSAVMHDGRYVGHVNSAANVAYMLQPASSMLGMTLLETQSTSAEEYLFTDPWTGRALLISGNNLYEFMPVSDTLDTVTWVSKEFVLPRPVNFGAAAVYHTPPELGYSGSNYGTLKIYAWRRGDLARTLVYNQAIGKSGVPFRLPSGFMADIWQFEISTPVTVTALHVATSVKELRSV